MLNTFVTITNSIDSADKIPPNSVSLLPATAKYYFSYLTTTMLE